MDWRSSRLCCLLQETEMTPDDLKKAFASLTPDRQTYFLVITMLNLTICLRDPRFYQPHTPPAASRQAQGINELLHTIAGHLADLLSPSKCTRRPDDVLCEVLVEKATVWDCDWFLSDATERAISCVGK